MGVPRGQINQCFLSYCHLDSAGAGGYISDIIIHQIFFARAIGLNTSRDAAKTGEYQMIFPK